MECYGSSIPAYPRWRLRLWYSHFCRTGRLSRMWRVRSIFTTWGIAFRIPHVLGISRVCAIVDHLGRRYSGRDPLVSEPAAARLGMDGSFSDLVPVLRAILPSPFTPQ